jgi:hypothetical protein
MQTQLTKIIEEMQQRARTCETAALDSNEEALTGESSGKDKNTQDAKEWMIRSKVWIEAEAIVAECLYGKTDRAMAAPAGVMQYGEGALEL